MGGTFPSKPILLSISTVTFILCIKGKVLPFCPIAPLSCGKGWTCLANQGTEPVGPSLLRSVWHFVLSLALCLEFALFCVVLGAEPGCGRQVFYHQVLPSVLSMLGFWKFLDMNMEPCRNVPHWPALYYRVCFLEGVHFLLYLWLMGC